MANIILNNNSDWDAPSRNPMNEKPTLASIARDKGVMARKLAAVATEKRKKADELGLIAKQKRQIANDLASKLKAKNLKANAPGVMASRQVGGITGPGGRVVNPTYNTYP